MARALDGADARDASGVAGVDGTIEDSFPASDPPSWTLGQVASGPPPSLPGTLHSPAPAVPAAGHTTSARSRVTRAAAGAWKGAAANPLLLVGGAAVAASTALLLTGRSRKGHVLALSLGQIGSALLAAGLSRALLGSSAGPRRA